MTAARRPMPGALRIPLALAAVAALIGLLSPFAVGLPLPDALYWPLDLAVHWQWLYAAVLAAACLLAARWRPRRLWLLPLCLLPLVTASVALPRAAAGTPALQIAFANVHVSNADPARLLAWLARAPVDVLALAEVSPPFAAALQREAPGVLPYRVLHPRNDPWGIAVFSRIPLHDVRLVAAADGVPRLEATLDAGGPVRLVVLHPKPPMSPVMLRQRDAIVHAVARDGDALPRIVVGDFNASPWSRPLRDATHLGLRRATGLAPTWRAQWRLRPGIPIDHVLASTHWRVRSAEVGPDIGSDHRPVRVELLR